MCVCLFKCIFNYENGKFLLMAVWSLSLHTCQEFYIKVSPFLGQKIPQGYSTGSSTVVVIKIMLLISSPQGPMMVIPLYFVFKENC